jgi:hypothetical protein
MKNSTTGYAPNQLLIRREPSAILEQAERSNNPLAEKQVEQLHQQQILGIEALNKAANSAKPSMPHWKQGQKVWLEAKNLALPYEMVKLVPR